MRNKSVDFVKKQLPSYTDQLVLHVQPSTKDYSEEQLKHMRNWDIRFNRVIDGVSAGDEAVTISIDRVTGQIMNYQFGLSNMPYPKEKPEMLALDKAKELWLSQFDIKLNYVLEDGGFIGGIANGEIQSYGGCGRNPSNCTWNQGEWEIRS